jgi:outer membrane protein assembly factor BamB
MRYRRHICAGALLISSVLTVVGAPGPALAAAPAPCTAAAAGTGAGAVPQWLQFGGSGGRQDVDLAPAPSAGHLSVRWKSRQLDGAVYAQPLVSGKCLLVATEDNSVYAFNYASGALLWHTHIAAPVPGGDLPCGNIDPSGITGTPVVDPKKNALWAVTFTPGASAPLHQLVELSLTTGKVLRRQAIVVPGANPAAEQQRSALGLYGGQVYVPLGGLYGDCNNYVGAVAGLSETGTPAPRYWKVPTERGAGIWEPSGAVVLADGDLLVSTGNGAAVPGDAFDGSDAVIKLSPQLKMAGYFAPADWAQLDTTDGDLDSTGPAEVPGNMGFQVGKSGVGYLFSLGNLGHIGGQLASTTVCAGGAYGSDSVSGETVYVPCGSGLAAVKVVGRQLKVLWQSGTGKAGSPVFAGGRLFEETNDGVLHEVSASTGQQLSTMAFSSPVTDFPWLVPLGKTLYAPDGDYVVALSGL